MQRIDYEPVDEERPMSNTDRLLERQWKTGEIFEIGKLVRDKMVGLIEAAGNWRGKWETRKGRELRSLLRIKLIEETQEYLSREIGREDTLELVDVLETVYALAATHGISRDELEAMRVAKRDARGGFDEGVYVYHFVKLNDKPVDLEANPYA